MNHGHHNAASAPAGDGVETKTAYQRAYELLKPHLRKPDTGESGFLTPDSEYGQTLILAADALTVLAAALARPRAAVGEREALPDNTYTPYGKRSARNLAELLGIVSQEPTVVTVINRAYDEIVFLRALQSPPAKVEG